MRREGGAHVLLGANGKVVLGRHEQEVDGTIVHRPPWLIGGYMGRDMRHRHKTRCHPKANERTWGWHGVAVLVRDAALAEGIIADKDGT